MTNFSRKWNNKSDNSKNGFRKRVKETIIHSPSLKVKLEKAEKLIKIQLLKLDTLFNKLKENDSKILFNLNNQINKYDNKHAEIFANELVEIRKMLKIVSLSKYAFESILLRIETVKDVGDVVTILAPALSAVKNVEEIVIDVIPSSSKNFVEIIGVINDIFINTGQSNNINYDFEIVNKDSENIIREALALAQVNLNNKIPAIPQNLPEPISKVLEVLN